MGNILVICLFQKKLIVTSALVKIMKPKTNRRTVRYRAEVKTFDTGITFELSGTKRRSLFGSGGGPQAQNELERFVRHLLNLTPLYKLKKHQKTMKLNPLA